MSVNRPGTPARTPRRSRTVAEIVNDALAFVARLASVVFVASLAYLAYAVFSGALHIYPLGYPAALSNQLTANIHLAALALEVSAIVGSICLIVLLWGWEVAGPLFALAGGLLYAAMPYFGVPFLSEASQSLLRRNHPGHEILTAFRGTGLVFLVSAGLLFAGWAWDRLQTSLNAPRRAGGGMKLPFYSACWQTHICRAEISKLCAPGRKGFHKSCWRHKSGCICDESIADRVMSDARKKMGKDAEKWLGALAKAPAPTFADRFRSTRHKVANQKLACADCPIYSLHQIQKHRLLSPVIILGIPGLMLLKADRLHDWYGAFVNAIDRFTLHLAFDASRTAAMKSQVHVALDIPGMEWMAYGVFALLLITTGARMLEYWCFTVKL